MWVTPPPSRPFKFIFKLVGSICFICKYRHKDKRTDLIKDKQTGKRTNRQASGQTDRQTDK